MPISSAPPSGRKYRSSSRGSSASMSARIPLMNHAKARQRQIVVDDLDRNGPFGEQCGQPAGADDLHRSPVFRLRSEEHTSELQSLMRISYAVFCLKKKKSLTQNPH